MEAISGREEHLCMSPFSEFEEFYPDIVSTNSEGQMTGHIMDFFHQERLEMCTMTKASEIDHNVWLGPTPDPAIHSTLAGDGETQFDILIECSDLGRMDPSALKAIAEGSEEIGDQPTYLEFPSSGSIIPPTWSHTEADGILETCKWLYHVSHCTLPEPAPSQEVDTQGDSPMPFPSSPSPPPVKRAGRRILIHCTDGYTESTLLGLSYFSYATGLPVPMAWLDLHVSKQRNFFAYPSDVSLLTSIAPRLLAESPTNADKSPEVIRMLTPNEPQWIKNIDGSLPSRITSYMYLGNLTHANNPDLLREMGIRQILSVGETAAWTEGERAQWGAENIMVVQRVQDNGVDPLTEEIEGCLEFIGRLSLVVLHVSIPPQNPS
jgi:dual specificity MAP kinase phosphatase